jgi:exopolyphosphatase/guanosine-5'-triphosphate,3'-diphosphate pyrophosphatase
MRMLITDGVTESGRWEEVTGLGRGVDRTGRLSDEAIVDSLAVLAEYGRLMGSFHVERRLAIATSASRDAGNRERFFDLAEAALGVRPALIEGEEEARLSYAGATAPLGRGDYVVCDIGGGSTELVTAGWEVSVDVGSVRVTERALPSRPAPGAEVEAARGMVCAALAGVRVPAGMSLVGVAGTWTSLPGLARGEDADEVSRDEVTNVVDMLATLTVEETAGLPTLSPKRAPVILGGALIAEAVMDLCGAEVARVSVHDILDGVAMRLLALA